MGLSGFSDQAREGPHYSTVVAAAAAVVVEGACIYTGEEFLI